jgi:hypothetical protein
MNYLLASTIFGKYTRRLHHTITPKSACLETCVDHQDKIYTSKLLCRFIAWIPVFQPYKSLRTTLSEEISLPARGNDSISTRVLF